MKTKSRICWIGQRAEVLTANRIDGEISLGAYATKGSKIMWDPEDWPPVKCRVTVFPIRRGAE